MIGTTFVSPETQTVKLQVSGIYWQGRNEVSWLPGQVASLGHPCANLMSFGSSLLFWRTCLRHC